MEIGNSFYSCNNDIYGEFEWKVSVGDEFKDSKFIIYINILFI